MGKLFGEASFSFSQADQLTLCPRKFFYNHLSSQEPFADHAKALKSLTSPSRLAGSVVDAYIAMSLKHCRSDATLALRDDLADLAEAGFRAMASNSKIACEKVRNGIQCDIRDHPFHEHYHGREVPEEEIEESALRVGHALRRFAQSDFKKKLFESERSAWMVPNTPVPLSKRGDDYWDRIPYYLHDGKHKVFASLDFHFSKDGLFHIVDWKTGELTERSMQKALRQLHVYGLWAINTQPSVEFDSVRLWPIFLCDGAEPHPLRLNQGLLDVISADVPTHCQAVMDRVEFETVWQKTGKGIYRADMEKFAPSPSPRKCHFCSFQTICADGQAMLNSAREAEFLPVEDLGDDSD